VNLAVTILIGVAVGVIMELLLPRHTLSELLQLVLLGVAGALVARHIGVAAGWFGTEEPASFLASAGGAILLLLIYVAFLRRGKKRHP
jgi:uncharacterized membrane protein YeaQ/YmgE (transglycosylase-associated protein family)